MNQDQQPIATPRTDAVLFKLMNPSVPISELESLARTLERELHEEKLHLEESFEMNRELQSERDTLRAALEKVTAALSISRGQWYHSVNRDQCLEALNHSKSTTQ